MIVVKVDDHKGAHSDLFFTLWRLNGSCAVLLAQSLHEYLDRLFEFISPSRGNPVSQPALIDRLDLPHGRPGLGGLNEDMIAEMSALRGGTGHWKPYGDGQAAV